MRTAVTEEIRRLVLGFFSGDEDKTTLWFSATNPLLGEMSPDRMVAMGREDRLLRFVREQLSQNEPPRMK